MSRCFPFPPPGYEKKLRSVEHEELLAKENQKGKKHKKEKRDKEKRENKDRKDKDRSKDKHKEKKERKEKHKERKKDKDKDKSRTSEDRRTEDQTEIPNEVKPGIDSRKAEEVKNSKFAEELGRRIRDEERGAANRMVEEFKITTQRRMGIVGSSTTSTAGARNDKMVGDIIGTVVKDINESLTPSVQRRIGGLGTSTAMEKQKAAIKNKVPDFNSTERKRNESLTPPIQRRIESLGNPVAVEKQRAANDQRAAQFNYAEQRRNGVTTRPVDTFANSVPRAEGKFFANQVQKETVAGNNMVSVAIDAPTKRKDTIATGQPLEKLSSSIQRNIAGGTAPATEKQRLTVPNSICTEKRIDDTGQQVEKDLDKKKDRKEKKKEKKAKDGKGGGHKDRDQEKKKKRDKDRHKDKEKEKEKTIVIGEHTLVADDKLKESGRKDQTDDVNSKAFASHQNNVKPADKLREYTKKDQIDGPNIEPLASDQNNVKPDVSIAIAIAIADGNNRKRKELEINGFLHEPQLDERPNKLLRTHASSHQPSPDNGNFLEFSHITSSSTSIKHEAINNTVAESCLDSKNNKSHINGKTEAQPSPVVLRPPANTVDSRKSSKVKLQPPHPDSEYLSLIYSVPKMEEPLELDDEEWLFKSEKPRLITNVDADGAPPHVWATGMQIEDADVFALPYVIPF